MSKTTTKFLQNISLENPSYLPNMARFQKTCRESPEWTRLGKNPCGGILKFSSICEKLTPKISWSVLAAKFSGKIHL
jgi:hypothetical protein